MLFLLKDIFKKPRYIFSFLLSAAVVWLMIGIYQHGDTFVSLWSVLDFNSWLKFVLNFSSLIVANMSTASLLVMILNIVGISLYITIKIYAYKIHSKTRTALGVIGSILVFFGIGCASCGSLALVSIISFLGFGSALVILPFGGHEIPYIALALLSITNYILLKQLAKRVCPV